MNRTLKGLLCAGMLAWGLCLLPSCAMEGKPKDGGAGKEKGTAKSEGSGSARSEGSGSAHEGSAKAGDKAGEKKEVGTVDDKNAEVQEIKKSDEEWKNELSAEEFRVLRQKGTERAFTGKYWDSKKDGTYLCAGCGLELFSSQTKFKSGTGWPSFYEPVKKQNVGEIKDASHGMTRTEVVCARCKGHLGHVFSDGPKPTGLRYCINSVSLELKEKADADTKKKE